MNDVDLSYRITRLRGRRLPLVVLPKWYVDQPCATRRRRSHVTLPGTGKGRKPGNFGKKWPCEILTHSEIGALLAACPWTGAFGPRNRAIITTLWRTGLRVAELCSLDVRDIDFDRRTVLVRCGKGSKRGVVGIDDVALEVIREWLDARSEFAPADGPLFVTLERGWAGRRIKPEYVREMLHRLAKRAGISRRVTPHSFRHSHAYELMEEGVPLASIQSQLRHSNLAITAHYLAHIAPLDAIKLVQAREWR